jgi:hypothetical protein
MLLVDLLVELAADTAGLSAADNPNGHAHLRPGSEPLQVPALVSDLSLLHGRGGIESNNCWASCSRSRRSFFRTDNAYLPYAEAHWKKRGSVYRLSPWTRSKARG